ncbi:hypothetical protein PVAG01_05869 [Phlyctema vagabunda]|uniref:Uncharacterized protein n=1 Tax=Phlyctema vagabunda TaxID=108571 RepID=A0ABR4PEH7_9HELO
MSSANQSYCVADSKPRMRMRYKYRSFIARDTQESINHFTTPLTRGARVDFSSLQLWDKYQTYRGRTRSCEYLHREHSKKTISPLFLKGCSILRSNQLCLNDRAVC